MAISYTKMGPDWRDFLEAYARTLRRIRKQAFRDTMSLANVPTRTDLDAAAHDEGTLQEFQRAHPDHPGVAEMMEDLRGLRERFSGPG